MIVFKEKQYTEYENTRLLYNELTRYGEDRNMRVEIINRSQLIPVLKGDCVVVEKFVISTSFFGKDKYRMYIKIGARTPLPEAIKLDSQSGYEKVGKLTFKINTGDDNNNNNNNNKNNKKNNKGKNFSVLSGKYDYSVDLQRDTRNPYGEVIKYDKKSRELIIECDSVRDAVYCLKILPFGFHYKRFLLDQQ